MRRIILSEIIAHSLNKFYNLNSKLNLLEQRRIIQKLLTSQFESDSRLFFLKIIFIKTVCFKLNISLYLCTFEYLPFEFRLQCLDFDAISSKKSLQCLIKTGFLYFFLYCFYHLCECMFNTKVYFSLRPYLLTEPLEQYLLFATET